MPHRARLPTLDDSRAVAAERELQDFSYIVSHDLAASFRHVSEFSRLLIGDLGRALTPIQQSHAERIRVASARCQAMMEELLVFSRLQQKWLTPVGQDATAVARLALLQLGAEVQAAGAEVSIEPLGEVDADPPLLALAVRHLLDNAIKFRRPGVPPRIVVSPAHDEAFWRMRVSDNGVGVDPAYREKAFRMFQQLNGAGAHPGVGGGLAICRRIARRHGGEVLFIDCAEGACVELALPRAKPGQ